MKFNNYSTTEEMKQELATRFKATRLSLNYSQAYVASKSGVSLRTIKTFEKNGSISFDNLIRILKTLNIGDNLNYLIPEIGLNTVDLHNLGHQKQRIGKKANIKKEKWGDEQ